MATLDLSVQPPLARAAREEISADYQKLIASPIVRQLLDSFPEPAVILNFHRQTVLANDKLARLVGREPEQLLGLRPGEIFNCVHVADGTDGCGTSAFCTQCGAAQATADAQITRIAQVQECRIACSGQNGPASMDLRVWATPLAYDRQFTVFAVRDVTDEKRRAVLERLFFHDVLNSAGGLKGVIEILPELKPDELPEMNGIARHLAEQLLEEIQSQRDLAAAERGELPVTLHNLDAGELLMHLCVLYGHHMAAAGKVLAPPCISGVRTICSDEVLLGRILGNLIKNALEASTEGQTVRVSFENNGIPTFSVHNESAMPPAVQLQIFQRSFSTKASAGRGLGTYSVKLLTERYLRGVITFESSNATGTTFTLRLTANRAC